LEQWITCRRVLSDNGPAYRSGDWRKACRALDLKPIRTKPYTPRTNGKAARFIKTLLAEWAPGRETTKRRGPGSGWKLVTCTGYYGPDGNKIISPYQLKLLVFLSAICTALFSGFRLRSKAADLRTAYRQ
jgi:transposase InsO family protein